MSWTVGFNSALSVLQVRISGTTTGKDLKDVTIKVTTMIREKDVTSILIDLSEVESVASTLDIFSLPAHQYYDDDVPRQTCIALIMPKSPKEQEDVLFYETACLNRGWNVRSFQDRDSALEWLESML